MCSKPPTTARGPRSSASTPTLIRHMLRPVDWKNTKLFVEYGPGVGTFCRPVLEHLPGDATLIAIDTNEDFIDYLKKDIRDSRFIAVHGSAADVEAIVAAHGFERADYVPRSEEDTSELQSLMRISYAVFCLKKKKHNT